MNQFDKHEPKLFDTSASEVFMTKQQIAEKRAREAQFAEFLARIPSIDDLDLGKARGRN